MKRRISLEKDFMDWRKDDIMYACLLNLAEYRKQDNVLFVDKRMYYDARDDIMSACEYKSRNSLRNNMKKWLESGLIEEGQVEWKYGGKKQMVEAYILKNRDDNGRYQLVDLDILNRLIETKNKNCIRIYTYLLNKYKFKKNYVFTLKELRMMLGYAEKSRERIEQRITHILQDLQMTGYLDWEIVYKEIENENGSKISVPFKVLTYVADKIEDLPEAKKLSRDNNRENDYNNHSFF